VRKVFFLFLILIFLFGCARPPRPLKISYKYRPSKTLPGWLKPYKIKGKTYYPLPSAEGYEETCIASWYGFNFHGRLTASGEVYNMYDFTAAHKTLPLGVYVLVTNLENGKKVVVKINDRGPFVKNRCIDLSYAAARALGMIKKGTAKVKIVVLSPGKLTSSGVVYKNIPNIRYGNFYLQVGAFRYYHNALKLKLKLEREFRRIEIEPFVKGNTVFYRVQIYLGKDFYLASKRAKELKNRFRNAFLIAK